MGATFISSSVQSGKNNANSEWVSATPGPRKSSRDHRCFRNPSSGRLVVQFCHDTSLHGLKYIAQKDRHVIERIFWLIAFICGFVLAGYLISDVWSKYKSNPVFVAFAPKELSISKFPFPAITICNMNRIMKKVALEIQKNATSIFEEVRLKALDEMRIMRTICDTDPSLSKLMTRYEENNKRTIDPSPYKQESGTSVIDFLFKASQPCEEMVQRCFFGDIEFECNIYPVITESGLCCSLNMMPNHLLLHHPAVYEPHNWEETVGKKYLNTYYKVIDEWAKWDYTNGFVSDKTNLTLYPFSPSSAGKINSLSLLLFPDLDNYHCTSSDSTGFMVAAHKPIESPHPINFGMVIPEGAEVLANVIPELTMAESIADVSIASRSCYFMHEFPLKYYKIYTDSNCEDECRANFTIESCGCAFYYQPRDNSTRICEEIDLECTKNVTANLQFQAGHLCWFCFPLCNELNYRISSSLSTLQNHSMLWDASENENISSSDWYGKPVSILNVFYSERTTVPKARKKLFGSTDLIANVGGLLGLCLGFSGLSLVELIYFCTIRTWFQKRRIGGIFARLIWKLIKTFKKLTGNITPDPPGKQILLDKNKISIIINRGRQPWDAEENLNGMVQNYKYLYPNW